MQELKKSSHLSEKLDRIFADLERAQAGETPLNMPSYTWQGDHLSVVLSSKKPFTSTED
jgi:hypothetical protein